MRRLGRGQAICDFMSMVGSLRPPRRDPIRHGRLWRAAPPGRGTHGARTPVSSRPRPARPPAEPYSLARHRIGDADRRRPGGPLLPRCGARNAFALSAWGSLCAAAPPPPSASRRQTDARLAESTRRGHGAGARGVWHHPACLDRAAASLLSDREDGSSGERTHCAPRAGKPRLCLPPSHLDGACQSGGATRLPPKKEGVEALVSAGAATPVPDPRGPALPLLPEVRHEVIDPADKEAVGWLGDLLAAGRADLYAQDEADLALLPTLTRTWMLRGEQLKIPAPGINEKRSVSCATDLAQGTPLWRTD